MIPAYSCYGCDATVPFKYPLFRLGCAPMDLALLVSFLKGQHASISLSSANKVSKKSRLQSVVAMDRLREWKTFKAKAM